MRAEPNGYTLLLVGPANTINATLYENLNYNFIRDIALAASVVRIPTVNAFVADAKHSSLIAHAIARAGLRGVRPAP